jgi:hypothetical protein
MNKVTYVCIVIAAVFSMIGGGMYMHELKSKPNPNTSSVGSIR